MKSKKKSLISRIISRMILNIKDIFSPHSIYKWYCVEERLWEEKITYLSFSYYKYSIWENGIVSIKTTMFKKPISNYIKKSTTSVVYIGKKEFTEVYKGSWLRVPTNYNIDLNKE